MFSRGIHLHQLLGIVPSTVHHKSKVVHVGFDCSTTSRVGSDNPFLEGWQEVLPLGRSFDKPSRQRPTPIPLLLRKCNPIANQESSESMSLASIQNKSKDWVILLPMLSIFMYVLGACRGIIKAC